MHVPLHSSLGPCIVHQQRAFLHVTSDFLTSKRKSYNHVLMGRLISRKYGLHVHVPLESLLVSESAIWFQNLTAWISQSCELVSWVEAEEVSTKNKKKYRKLITLIIMVWVFHKFTYIITTDLQVYNTNSLCDQLPVGLLAQMIEKSTAVALQRSFVLILFKPEFSLDLN